MSLPQITDQERHTLITDALKPFENDFHFNGLFEICDCLFKMALNEDQFLHDDADNPIEHHTTVLAHMAEIVKTELDEGRFDYNQIKQAVALAILHDICPVRKITEDMISSAPPEQREGLQKERESSVPLHMSNGAKMAREKLLALNKNFNDQIFDDKQIDFICDIISIHDNPKLGIKIPEDNPMAIMLREADRLWMVTPMGVCADLKRKHIKFNDPEAQVQQVKKNIKRFEEERKLYSEQDGPFCDDKLFFRIKAAKKIFDRWHSYWTMPSNTP
jgi:hypothetical protein